MLMLKIQKQGAQPESWFYPKKFFQRQILDLSDRTVQLVKEFYLSDAVSRIMPGKRDCISVKVNGKKTLMQKQLLLSNLIEVHRQFQNEHPDVKVGRSKLMELCPKNVVLAGTAGTHVCECALHQNVKLTFEGCKHCTSTCFKEMLGLPDDALITYKHLLAKLSCNPPQPECYLGEYSMCSNVEDGCDFCNEDSNAAECVYCSKVPQLKTSLMAMLLSVSTAVRYHN